MVGGVQTSLRLDSKSGMDGSGQQGQEGQRQMMDQQQLQQQGGWYGGPQNPYQHHHQPQAFKWPGYDPSMHYAQPPVQSFGQPDYYMQQQQQQHYASALPQQPPVQQPQQHLHIYAQQEQVWPSNNGWSQPQWNHQGTSTGSEEEDWAAKARAWAAAKAAQEEAQQAAQQAQAQIPSQTVVLQQEQSYQEYQQDTSEALRYPPEPAQQSSLLPPGQETTQGYSHDAPTSFVQDGHSYPPEPLPAYVQEDVPPSFDGASSAYSQAAHAQVVSSSYSQDVSSSYGQDTAIAGPPGTDQQDHANQNPAPHPSVVQVLPQVQQSQVPAQVSPHAQAPQFPYQDPIPPAFEFHQHQQFDYQHPPPQDYQQQPPGQYLPPASSMGMDAAEMNFGPPNAISVWPPMGGQGLPFPPNMGPGGPGSHPGPQFDHPHRNHHHHHSHPMHGHQPPHMFPRQHGPPHGPGFRPPGPPLGGPFGFGGSPSLGQGPGGPMFLNDGNGNLGPPDRPKKASVPSWLREELLKKKPAVGLSNSAVMSVSDDLVRVNGNEPSTAAGHKLGVSERTRSDSSGMSDNDEDDEDETEAARTAAMNQEIKRVLTEVLLKVTDDLFEEIAQEVLDEEEILEGQGHRSISAETVEKDDTLQSTSSPPPLSPPAAPPSSIPARVLVAPVKQNRAPIEDDSDSTNSEGPIVNVLGLATYASDDEDGERGQRQHSASTDPETTVDISEDKISDHVSVRTSRDESIGERKGHEGNALSVEEEKSRKREKETETEHEDKRDIEGEKKDKHREKERGRDRESRGREKVTENEERKDQRSDSKGKKRSNEDTNSSDHDTRSPRRARHVEAEHDIIDGKPSSKEKVDTELSAKQSRTGNSRRHVSDIKEGKQSVPVARVSQKKALDAQAEFVDPGEKAPNAGHAVKELPKMEAKPEKHTKDRVQSTDGSGVALLSGITKGRVESVGAIITKSRDNEDGNRDRDRSKHRSRDVEKDHDDKADRSRDKEKVQDKELDKENEKGHEKEKTRDSERGADRERSKVDRGKERGRGHERDRKKVDKERSERGRDRRKESRENKRSRRRSSSASSRGRSRSKSPSSGSHASSSGGDKSRSPKLRRQPGRQSRRLSISRSPVRFRRRRPSRSRSRSPPSKYSHRRHSPSPSRETERHR